MSLLTPSLRCNLIKITLALTHDIARTLDIKTVRRIATYITFPSLALRTFLDPAPLAPASIALVIGLYFIAVLIPAILTWASTKYMHPKERGVLAGLSLGSSVDLFGLPLIVGASSALWTTTTTTTTTTTVSAASLASATSATSLATTTAASVMIYTGCLLSLVNVLVTRILAPLYFSTAGPAFPKDFKHTDGGIYNGEWKGALKDGFGVYTYPSGASYEGEWLDGTKEGRGIYRFAKGGIYEGEWRNGKMEGVGVRTYSSGKVSSGLWEQGKLVKPIDESQCALVVANANEAALCAKKVFVGGIDGGEIVRGVATQPALLVGIAALAMGAWGGGALQLPKGLDAVTSELAKAHGVLSLVGFGMLMDRTAVEERQVRDAQGAFLNPGT
jgi:hypothetical protein